MGNGRRAGGVRPRTVAAGFSVYVLVIALYAGFFAQTTSRPWFGPDLSRWVYITDIACAAVLLAGLGVAARILARDFEERLRRIGRPGSAAAEDTEISAWREDEFLSDRMAQARADVAPMALTDHEIRESRRRLQEDHRRRIRLLTGPAVATLALVMIALPLIPAVDGMLQREYVFNTAMILAIGYGWLGLGLYVLVSLTLAAHTSSRDTD